MTTRGCSHQYDPEVSRHATDFVAVTPEEELRQLGRRHGISLRRSRACLTSRPPCRPRPTWALSASRPCTTCRPPGQAWSRPRSSAPATPCTTSRSPHPRRRGCSRSTQVRTAWWGVWEAGAGGVGAEGGTLAQPLALWCLLSQCAGGLALRARAATSPPFTAPPTRRRRDQGAGGGDRSAAAGRQRVQGHVGRRRAGALCVPRAAAATTAPAQPIWRVS